MRRRVRALFVRYVRKPWSHSRWIIVGVLAVVAIALGYWGWSLVDDPTSDSIIDRVYRSVQLFPLESGGFEEAPWQLEVARILAPLVGAYAALSALTAIFRDQTSRLHTRLFAHDHVIVCGLGSFGRRHALALTGNGDHVVALEVDTDSPAVGDCRDGGVVVLPGDATDPSLLRSASVRRARLLIAACGEDAANIAIAAEARRLTAGRRRPLDCRVEVRDGELGRLLTREELARTEDAMVRVEFFQLAETGSRVLLDEFPAFDATGSTPLGPPHLLIIGLGEMGRALVVEAARRWRLQEQPGNPLRVSVVERAANRHVESMQVRFPRLEATCDIDAFDVDVASPEFQRADFLAKSNGGASITTVYVCLATDTEGLSAAVVLRRELGTEVPVVVRTTAAAGPADIVAGSEQGGIQAFPVFDRIARPDVLLRGVNETIARGIHEDYVSKQRAEGQTPTSNPSMVAWAELPETLKESNRDQAANVGAKLHAVGRGLVPLTDWDEDPVEFTSDEVERLAVMEHERWRQERAGGGWTPGPKRDSDSKHTPYLVPWEELSEEIREYDRDTVRALPGILASAGFAVVRAPAPRATPSG
ncbi:MAG: NAD-binding protein [Acidimicrobiia bacterium]